MDPLILFEHDMFKKIHSLFLNLNIALQNLLAISVTTASAEQNFSKNYHQSKKPIWKRSVGSYHQILPTEANRLKALEHY